MKRPLLLAFVLLVGLGLAPMYACQGSPSQAVLLPLHYIKAPSTFTNNTGWKIELSKAQLSLGALRCLQESNHVHTLLRKWFTPAVAFAHPGHTLPEDVKAELLFTDPLDLLNTKDPWVGNLHGFTGHYASVELEFGAKHGLVVEGKASTGTKELHFAFSLAPGAQKVSGIPFKHRVTSALTLQMKLSMERLFEGIDFHTFQSEDTAAKPDKGSQNILRKALLSNALYTFQTPMK